jgi:hypothetical protein
MLVPVRREQRWKEVETRRRRGPQANPADGSARDLLHPFVRAVDGAENAPRLFEEDFTGDGQRDAASGSIQELGADLFFELRDLVRDRRLREVAEARGSGKPASTIGFERRYNLAFATEERDTFVQLMLADIPPRPARAEETRAANLTAIRRASVVRM